MEATAFTREFGRRVERRRRILGLTQAEVGAVIGMDRSRVSQVEQGVIRALPVESLARLAQVLQTSTDYLLQLVHEDPGPVPDEPRSGEHAPVEGFILPVTTTR